MTLQEFAQRTKFRPTEQYFNSVIHEAYMASDLDKDEWCKMWLKQGGIQQAYNYMVLEAANNYANYIRESAQKENLQIRIKRILDITIE